MSEHEPTLFIPGPTEVFPEVLATLARPVISHRGPEIEEISREVFANLKRLFRTGNECYFANSSATGFMEAAARNLVRDRALATVCGAFSERQAQVLEKCGKKVDVVRVEPGRIVQPDDVARALERGSYDLVTVVHSETSTGVLNPVQEIADVVRQNGQTLLAVDCVSSLGGAPVDVDAWGADLVFAGTQKCLALPPGLTVFSVSPRAMERASSIPDRGHYFDLLNYRKMAERGQSPATVAVSLVFALQFQLRRILDEETLEARWARHQQMADLVRERLAGLFRLFPDPAHMTPAETVLSNDRGFDVAAAVDAVREKGKLFANGYGPLKGKTLRIGHMGDLQPRHVERFLEVFLATLKELGII